MELQSRRSNDPTAAPDSDVVVSCRVRMARNIAGIPFVNRATDAQSQDVLNLSRPALLRPEVAEGMIWVDMNKATPRGSESATCSAETRCRSKSTSRCVGCSSCMGR